MTRTSTARSTVLIAASFGMFTGLVSLQANEPNEPSQRQAGLVCMERTNGIGKVLSITVPARSVPSLLDRGFSNVDCGGPEFTHDRQIAFRDQVCKLVAEQPEGMQLQFENILGERPSVLCGMAEAVTGPWKRAERGR